MFVGHGLLAFAIVGLAATHLGLSRQQALAVAAVAALFGTLPDVDILYGPLGLLGGVAGLGDAVSTFWATGNEVHRGPTHSLVIGALAASGFGLVASRRRLARFGGLALLLGVVGLTAAESGGLDAAVVLAFVAAGGAVVAVARRLDVRPLHVPATALVGLLTHPFGDLLTGSPPALLYPLEWTVIGDRVVIHPDPTVHLLAAFAVELAVIWLAVFVYFDLIGRSVRSAVEPLAGVGTLYGLSVVILPAPTVDYAWPFVVSVLSVGLVGAVRLRSLRRSRVETAVATGIAAVTCAAVAYAVGYALV